MAILVHTTSEVLTDGSAYQARTRLDSIGHPCCFLVEGPFYAFAPESPGANQTGCVIVVPPGNRMFQIRESILDLQNLTRAAALQQQETP